MQAPQPVSLALKPRVISKSEPLRPSSARPPYVAILLGLLPSLVTGGCFFLETWRLRERRPPLPSMFPSALWNVLSFSPQRRYQKIPLYLTNTHIFLFSSSHTFPRLKRAGHFFYFPRMIPSLYSHLTQMEHTLCTTVSLRAYFLQPKGGVKVLWNLHILLS